MDVKIVCHTGFSRWLNEISVYKVLRQCLVCKKHTLQLAVVSLIVIGLTAIFIVAVIL